MPLDIIRNDITRVPADAIVNTANPYVAVGTGTDQAIYEAAGREQLLAERAKIGEMRPGQAAYTPAFALPAKYIIHTVGPAWRGGRYHERETVAECYRNCLDIADKLGCETVAFPLLSSGNYGFPKDEALKIAISEISSFLFEHDMTVLLVVYDKESFVVSGKAFSNVKSFIAENEIRTYSSRRQQARGHLGSDLEEDRSVLMSPNAMPFEEELKTLSSPKASPKAAGSEKRKSRLRDILHRRDTGAISPIRESQEELQEDAGFESKFEDFEAGYGSFEDEALLNDSIDLSDDLFGPFEDSEALADYFPEQAKITAPLQDSVSGYKELTIDDIIRMKGDTFQQVLFKIIDRKGLSDPEVYKKANIDRKLFSKIRSDVDYMPSKRTALALIIGLELNIDEATDLLQRAGFSFSPSSISDLTIQSCIMQHLYDIHTINCFLFDLGQKPLV